MKLVGIIENVNQKGNEYLIGSIVIVDSELVLSGDYELCYQELEHDRTVSYDNLDLTKYLHAVFKLKHAVNNIEIIGVLWN